MIGVVALRTRADGAGERVITWCCGSHRAENCCEDSKCVACCPECPTCPEVLKRTPEQRAMDARELRQRQMHIRMQAQQAELVATMAGLDDLLEEVTAAMHRELDESMTQLARATAAAVAVGDLPPRSS